MCRRRVSWKNVATIWPWQSRLHSLVASTFYRKNWIILSHLIRYMCNIYSNTACIINTYKRHREFENKISVCSSLLYFSIVTLNSQFPMCIIFLCAWLLWSVELTIFCQCASDANSKFFLMFNQKGTSTNRNILFILYIRIWLVQLLLFPESWTGVKRYETR